MRIKSKIILSIAVFLVCFSLGTAIKVMAGVGDNVSGWLWGGSEDANIGPVGIPNDGNETGVGWISMNSTDCDSDGNNFFDVDCGGNNTTTSVVDYGVNIPADGGNLSGYAWSKNLGWISFNEADLVGCPIGNCSAKRSGNDLAGWARIISISQAGINSGGWQGFISLSGNASDGSVYGVKISQMDGTGANPTYAWSDELGWINFSKAKVNISSPPPPPPICSCACANSICKGKTCDDGCGNPCPGERDCAWREVAP